MNNAIFKNKIQLLPLILLGILLLIGTLIFIKWLFPPKNQFVFYYPEMHYTIMGMEKRIVDYNKNEITKEEAIVRQYLLGPLKYNLRFTLSLDLKIRDIWIIEKPFTNGLVINFDSGLSEAIRYHNQALEWFLLGLIRTLKENTQIKRIYILEQGQRKSAHIGKWQIEYPIPVE